MSLHSRQRSTISRASRNLSEMSVTSKKSTKLINASLEHVHTFGMANTHKGRYDLEKIDNQYDNLLDTKKKISKTTSGKLDPAKPFEDLLRELPEGRSVDCTSIRRQSQSF